MKLGSQVKLLDGTNMTVLEVKGQRLRLTEATHTAAQLREWLTPAKPGEFKFTPGRYYTKAEFIA
jgi:hypothetical protein